MGLGALDAGPRGGLPGGLTGLTGSINTGSINGGQTGGLTGSIIGGYGFIGNDGGAGGGGVGRGGVGSGVGLRGGGGVGGGGGNHITSSSNQRTKEDALQTDHLFFSPESEIIRFLQHATPTNNSNDDLESIRDKYGNLPFRSIQREDYYHAILPQLDDLDGQTGTINEL